MLTFWNESHRIQLTVFVFSVAVGVLTANAAAIEILDTFDDGNLHDDSPVSWFGSARAENGDLVLSGTGSNIVNASPHVDQTVGWSIQAQARLGGSYFFGLMDDARNVGGRFSNGWSGLDDSGTVWIGEVFQRHESVSTDLRPTDEDVMLQLDSFDDTFRVWAWPPSEPRPDEPLLERSMSLLGDSGPTLWVRNPSGGSVDATFRWVHFSTEKSLPDPGSAVPLIGDFDGDGMLGVTDIEMLSEAIQTASTGTSFDLTNDGLIDSSDLANLVSIHMDTWLGDANLDGEFNSSDLITALAGGTYEADVDAGWESGDFDGSGRFDSGDLIFALADGGYENGPRAAVSSVPEPSSILLIISALVLSAGRRQD